MANISEAIQDLRQRLNQLRSLIQVCAEVSKCIAIWMVILSLMQDRERILRMVNESLSNDGSSILGSLMRPDYAEPLKQIAKDAVKDYLSEWVAMGYNYIIIHDIPLFWIRPNCCPHSCSLNTAIGMLNVATDVPNTTVVIYHRQFAYPESFIVRVSWDIFFYQNIPRLYHNNYVYSGSTTNYYSTIMWGKAFVTGVTLLCYNSLHPSCLQGYIATYTRWGWILLLWWQLLNCKYFCYSCSILCNFWTQDQWYIHWLKQ